jgi:hypothetical protein
MIGQKSSGTEAGATGKEQAKRKPRLCLPIFS